MKNIQYNLILLLLLFISAFAVPPVGLNIADTTVVKGSEFALNIKADSSLTGLSVLSYQLQMSYNSSYLQFQSIETSSTISSGFTVNSNAANGLVTIAGAGTTPLSGKGILIKLKFKAIQTGYGYINFTGANSANMLNEGNPAVVLENGSINITNPPTIQINPDTGLLAKGEKLQFNAYYGSGAITWSVTDNLLADISSTGLLTAQKEGLVRVIGKDANNIIDTTNIIEIRAAKVWQNDTTFYSGAQSLIPIRITDLTGLNITSGQINFTFNNNSLEVNQIVTTGTLLAGTAPVYQTGTDYLNVAFATSAPLSGSGILFYVKGIVRNSTYLNFNLALCNENILLKTDNGYISAATPPAITVTAPQAFVMSGSNLQFSLSGGIAPYQWTVTDTSLATINSTGLLTAKKGGLLQVKVTDNLATIGLSAQKTIYDFEVAVSDTSSNFGQEIDLPVIIKGQHDNAGFSSMQFIFQFDTNYVRYANRALMPDGWNLSVNKNAGTLSVAAAANSNYLKNGALMKFGMKLKPNLTNNNYTNLTLSSVVFDEGFPLPLVTNGRIFARDSLARPSKLRAVLNASQVLLKWHDRSTNESGFVIERKNGEITTPFMFDAIGKTADTTMTDTNVPANKTYTYRVAAYNNWLSSAYSNLVEISVTSSISDASLDKSTVLFTNYPNPFNNTTTITYSLRIADHAKLGIYNSKGEIVKTLANGMQSAGRHSVSFDANGLNSGVYFYKLESDGKSLVNKMILVK